MEQNTTKRISVNLSEEDFETINLARKTEKRTLGNFLVYSGLERAKDILQENEE